MFSFILVFSFTSNFKVFFFFSATLFVTWEFPWGCAVETQSAGVAWPLDLPVYSMFPHSTEHRCLHNFYPCHKYYIHTESLEDTLFPGPGSSYYCLNETQTAERTSHCLELTHIREGTTRRMKLGPVGAENTGSWEYRAIFIWHIEKYL